MLLRAPGENFVKAKGRQAQAAPGDFFEGRRAGIPGACSPCHKGLEFHFHSILVRAREPFANSPIHFFSPEFISGQNKPVLVFKSKLTKSN